MIIPHIVSISFHWYLCVGSTPVPRIVEHIVKEEHLRKFNETLIVEHPLYIISVLTNKKNTCQFSLHINSQIRLTIRGTGVCYCQQISQQTVHFDIDKSAYFLCDFDLRPFLP